ncbi:GspE/PulE family protein [Kamptonema cortianum]|nr:GspE/PulE family protein [Geitlerinema splendidum]MDK3162245.1 GspE/PulE family protein [Kamptonema cortianum]
MGKQFSWAKLMKRGKGESRPGTTIEDSNSKIAPLQKTTSDAQLTEVTEPEVKLSLHAEQSSTDPQNNVPETIHRIPTSAFDSSHLPKRTLSIGNNAIETTQVASTQAEPEPTIARLPEPPPLETIPDEFDGSITESVDPAAQSFVSPWEAEAPGIPTIGEEEESEEEETVEGWDDDECDVMEIPAPEPVDHEALDAEGFWTRLDHDTKQAYSRSDEFPNTAKEYSPEPTKPEPPSAIPGWEEVELTPVDLQNRFIPPGSVPVGFFKPISAETEEITSKFDEALSKPDHVEPADIRNSWEAAKTSWPEESSDSFPAEVSLDSPSAFSNLESVEETSAPHPQSVEKGEVSKLASEEASSCDFINVGSNSDSVELGEIDSAFGSVDCPIDWSNDPWLVPLTKNCDLTASSAETKVSEPEEFQANPAESDHTGLVDSFNSSEVEPEVTDAIATTLATETGATEEIVESDEAEEWQASFEQPSTLASTADSNEWDQVSPLSEDSPVGTTPEPGEWGTLTNPWYSPANADETQASPLSDQTEQTTACTEWTESGEQAKEQNEQEAASPLLPSQQYSEIEREHSVLNWPESPSNLDGEESNASEVNVASEPSSSSQEDIATAEETEPTRYQFEPEVDESFFSETSASTGADSDSGFEMSDQNEYWADANSAGADEAEQPSFGLGELQLASDDQLEPSFDAESEFQEDMVEFYAEPGESAEQLIVAADEETATRTQPCQPKPLVYEIIANGISRQASDIHIEPRANVIDIRYRLDGKLVSDSEFPVDHFAELCEQFNELANLDLAACKTPQESKFTIEIENNPVDIRLSVLPSFHGPRVTMRVWDKSVGLRTLDDLGFESQNLELFKDVIRKPYGLFLVTGPTGSGKTTTLYAALNSLRDTAANIMTCEDPVEFDLDGISQSQVNESTGLTFSEQLKAILRQDPDVILVGEIRDEETAESAVRAAMTGHLVLSTLHCNDAPSAIARLLEMGIDPYLLSSSLIGTMSQRLVRKLCPECKVQRDPTPQEKEELKSLGVDTAVTIWDACGCDQCFNTGYKGRYAIQEIMPIGDELRELIASRATADQLKKSAAFYGFLSMQEDAVARVLAGETTLEEIRRFISFDALPKASQPRQPIWRKSA